MLKQIKEIMNKKLKQIRGRVLEQVGNSNKNTEIIKMNQVEIQKLKVQQLKKKINRGIQQNI